jgi:hypothetical protein
MGGFGIASFILFIIVSSAPQYRQAALNLCMQKRIRLQELSRDIDAQNNAFLASLAELNRSPYWSTDGMEKYLRNMWSTFEELIRVQRIDVRNNELAIERYQGLEEINWEAIEQLPRANEIALENQVNQVTDDESSEGESHEEELRAEESSNEEQERRREIDDGEDLKHGERGQPSERPRREG